MKLDNYANLESVAPLAALIDHTLLRPEASKQDIVRVCREGRENGFATVCINPYWVPLAAEQLRGARTKVCTVVGFPLGVSSTRTKQFEAESAIADGAQELDMVQNVGALRSGHYELVRREIQLLGELAHSSGVLLKVILETSLLNEEEKKIACGLAREARADFVKTSTGFSSGGAVPDDVRLMRHSVGDALGVKASGGVRTLGAVREMLAAGATRIGTSSGVQILAELARQNGSAAEQDGPFSQSGSVNY